jgi:hypothetical protein
MTPEEKFWSSVAIGGENECWNWKKAARKGGGGILGFRGKSTQAPLVAYTIAFGAPPKGTPIRHTCKNKLCCNPKHLIATSKGELLERNDEEVFWARVDKKGDNECWNWTDTMCVGFGQIYYKGKRWKAHRLAYILTFGNIPPRSWVHHTCKNHICCNPQHLKLQLKSSLTKREHSINWGRTNPEAKMLVAARYRAKQKGVPFDITIDDIVIPKYCPILGIKLKSSELGRKGNCPTSPSLDRIIPELGYVKGNVRVISQRANTLKSNATSVELEKILNDVRAIEARRPKD